MDKFLKFVEKASTIVVGVIFFIFSIYLLSISFLSTTVIDKSEKVLFKSDSPILLILCLMLFMFWLMVMYQKVKLSDKAKKIILYSAYALAGIFAVAFVLTTQLVPRADQKYVITIAEAFRNGDFSAMDKGAYLDKYPFQSRLVWVLYLLSFVFGKGNFVAIQLLNVVAFLFSAFFLGRIAKAVFKNDEVKFFTEIIFLFFVPLMCYVSFVYGNVGGLCLGLGAVYFELKFFESQKIIDMIISAVFISFAVLLKPNFLIFLVAMVIFLILDMVKKKKILKQGVSILILAALYFIVGFTADFTVKSISKRELSDGIPNTAWVALGLQEGWKGPGWYTRFSIDTYKENGYDTEKTKEAVLENISQSLDDFKSGKRDAVDFFARKTASQWNDPTFQCVNLMQGHESDVQEKFILPKFMYGENATWIFEIFNIVHTLMLFGILLWFVSEYKKLDVNMLILAVIFIGGFLFHLLWEAKAQYTVLFYVLIFPYCIMGYIKFIPKLSEFIKAYGKSTGSLKNKINIKKTVAVVVYLVLIIILGFMKTKTLNFSGDEKKIEEYFNSLTVVQEIGK